MTDNEKSAFDGETPQAPHDAFPGSAEPEATLSTPATQPPSVPLASDPDTDKEKRARLEKFAQANLDRAQTLSAGTTKTALAWAVALALIWFQVLEHRLMLVRTAQHSRNALVAIEPEQIGTHRLGAEVETSMAKLRTDELAAADQQIELPFSIKLTLPPYWIPTFWLLLALGLSVYMRGARDRIFRLTARGLRLQLEAGVDDPRIRFLVGGGVWWLAPIRSRSEKSPDSDPLREALGWLEPRLNTLAVAGAAATLLLMQARVQYVSLCVGGRLLYAGNHVAQSITWIGITFTNLVLGSVIAILIWRWFSDPRDPELLGERVGARAGITRRRLLSLAFGSALAGLAFASNLAAMFAFALGRSRRFPILITTPIATLKRNRHRKRKVTSRQAKGPGLPFGLYVNPKTGSVHISAPAPENHLPSCTSCIGPAWAARLRRVEPSSVQWNHPKPAGSRVNAFGKGVIPPDASNKPASPDAALHLDSTPHPHAAHRTFMVEQQAIALLHGGHPLEAIEFLLNASKAASLFGLRTGVRLYDLLAGLAVRYNRKTALDNLTAILRDELEKVDAYSERLGSAGGRLTPSSPPWVRFALFVAGMKNSFKSDAPLTSRRRRKPRHHQKDKASGYSGAHAKKSTSPIVDGEKSLSDSLRARIDKWSKTDSHWTRDWKSAKPIRWAGVKLPGLTKP